MVIAPPIVQPIAAPSSPVLALVARHDQYAPPERVVESTADWPDVEIEVIEGADHFLEGHTGVVAARRPNGSALVLVRPADRQSVCEV